MKAFLNYSCDNLNMIYFPKSAEQNKTQKYKYFITFFDSKRKCY